MSVTGSFGTDRRRQLWTRLLPPRVKAWIYDRNDNALAQRTAGAAFLIRVASAALALLSQIVLARWMGTHEFGIYVYAWTWTLLIGGFADAGLASAAQRFVPEYGERKTPALLRGFLSASRWLAATIAVALALVAALAVKLGEPLLDRATIVPLYLACLCLPSYALSSVQDGIARSYNWVHIGMMPTFVIRPALLLALMLAAGAAGFASDAATATVASGAAFWIVAIVQSVLIHRRLAQMVEPGPRAHDVGRWLATSLPMMMVLGFYTLLTYIDVIVLQWFRPPEDVALYHAAAKTLALVAFVYFSVSAATAHRFTEYHLAGDRRRLEAFIADAIRWTFWPSLAATALILALGKPFLFMFGPDFLAAYPLLFVLAIGLLARATVGPAERLLSMLGEQRACAAAYAGAFAFNLAACIVLVPHLGGIGAATATSSALLLESILLFLVARRRLGLHTFIWRRSADEGGGRKSMAPGRIADIAPAGTPAAPSDAQFAVEWQPLGELHAVADEWRSLAARAIEPNVFYEPAFALAAAPVFGTGVGALLVWSKAAPRRLVGLLPLRVERRYGVKLPVLVGWTHPYAPLGVPLIDRDEAVPIVAAALDHVAADPALPKLLLLPLIAENGPVAAAVRTATAERGAPLAAFGRHARALLAPGCDRGDYLDRAIGARKRKELRRQRRRLGEGGVIAFEFDGATATVAASLRDFLRLEADGWKGEAGTAALRHRDLEAFMQSAVTNLAAEGKVATARLLCDSRALAAAVTLRSGDGAWLWKIAYDETQARMSPGVQLTLDLTQALLGDRSVTFADSCATPDHPMIDHIWRERLPLADWLIGLHPGASFGLARRLEMLRRAALSGAKRVRATLVGR